MQKCLSVRGFRTAWAKSQDVRREEAIDSSSFSFSVLVQNSKLSNKVKDGDTGSKAASTRK